MSKVLLVLLTKISLGFILALQVTFGGMCMLPQHRGGMGFCPRAWCEDFSGSRNHKEVQKPWHPVGAPRRSAGASRLVFERRHLPPSRADKPPHGFWGAGRIISAQKPAEGNCIYRPVMCRIINRFYIQQRAVVSLSFFQYWLLLCFSQALDFLQISYSWVQDWLHFLRFQNC